MKNIPLSSLIFICILLFFSLPYFFSLKDKEFKDGLVFELNPEMETSNNFLFDLSRYNYALVFGKSPFGLPSYEFKFDGLDDSIIISDANFLSPSHSGEMTISFWAKFSRNNFSPSGGKNYIQFLGKRYSGNNEFSFRQYNSSNAEGKGNRISFYIFNLSGGLGSGSFVQEPLDLEKWIFLAGVFNGTHVSVYKNGILKDTDSLADYGIFPQNGNSPVVIGSLDGVNYFKGGIRSVRIYNRSLTQAEIAYLFSQKNKVVF